MAQHSGKMVKAALRAKGMTQSELAKRIGRDQTLISRYLSGQIEISAEAARAIAEVLDIDFELLRGQLEIDKLSHKLRRLNVAISRISGKTDAVSLRIDLPDELFQVAAVMSVEDSGTMSVPLLDSIPSRTRGELEEKVRKYVLPPDVQVDSEKSFALKVSGGNMTDDKIDEGDIIVVDPSAEVQNDDRVLVILSGKPALRKIYRMGETVVLQSSKDREEPVILLSQRDDLEIVGRVVLCIKSFID